MAEDVIFEFGLEHRDLLRGIDQIGKELKRSEKKAQSFGKKLAKALNPNISKTAIVGTLSGLAFAGIKAGNSFIEMDDALRLVNTNLRTTEPELQKVRGRIEEMSASLGKDAVQSTEQFFSVLSKGFTGDSAFDALKASLEVSVAGFTDVSETLPGVTAGMKVFGASADEVANAMATINEKGDIKFGDISKGFATVASVAQDLGLSLDEFSAFFAKITELGGPAEQNITKLKSAFVELGKPSVIKKLEKVTGLTGQLDPRTQGIQKALGAFSRLTPEQREQVTANSEALQAIVRLNATSGNQIEELIKLGREQKDLFKQQLERAKAGKGFESRVASEQLAQAWRSIGEETSQLQIDLLKSIAKFLKDNEPLIKEFTKDVIEILRNLMTWVVGVTPTPNDISRNESGQVRGLFEILEALGRPEQKHGTRSFANGQTEVETLENVLMKGLID